MQRKRIAIVARVVSPADRMIRRSWSCAFLARAAAAAGSVAYSHVIGDLIPGIEYFVRVSAKSNYYSQAGTAEYGPTAFSGYPNSPVGTIPVGVPGIPQVAYFNSDASSSELRVDFRQPADYLPEGSNGAPVQSYTVELSSAVDEVQTVGLAAAAGFGNVGVGSFRLKLDSDVTRCIPLGSSAAVVERYLEELSNVDGVSVSMVEIGRAHV